MRAVLIQIGRWALELKPALPIPKCRLVAAGKNVANLGIVGNHGIIYGLYSDIAY